MRLSNEYNRQTIYMLCGIGCFEVGLTTNIYAHEISWSVGSCKSNQSYSNNKVFTQECCLAVGSYKIKCKDSFGDGWHGGYLEIKRHQYCANFNSGHEEQADLIIGTG